MATAKTGSQLLINNETQEYFPNSLKYTIGRPERNVAPQVVGNGNTVNVTTEDLTTAKGKVSFDLKTTSENENSLNTWVQNFDQNLIKIVSSDGVSVIFENMVVVNQPEFDTGSDGIISVELEGAIGVFG